MISRESFLLAALLAAATLLAPVTALLAGDTDTPAPLAEGSPSAEAQYRGCHAQGWCLFEIESRHPAAGTLLRVRPDGVARTAASGPIALKLRDRLNALLANMIHQSKRIVLRDLRPLEDGTFAAVITVNGVEISQDPVLQEARRGSGSPGTAVRRRN